MKLNHKITIDLLEFVKSGQFDFIKLGQTKEWILQHFPDPDDLADSSGVYAHPIWQYGNIEFHFNQDKLSLIYSDYIDSLNGGENLELKMWLFAEPQKLSLAYVTAQLNRQRIDFTTTHKTYGSLSSVSLTVLKSGVMLSFSPAERADGTAEHNYQEDSNLLKLQSIGLRRS